MENRRRSTRRRLSLPIWLKDARGGEHSITLDVSAHGVSILTQGPRPLRQYVELEVKLPDNEGAIAVTGMVARNEPAVDPTTGRALNRMGLDFFLFDTESRSRWQSFLRKSLDEDESDRPVPREEVIPDEHRVADHDADVPVFLIRPRDMTRLWKFFRGELARSQVRIESAVLKAPGTVVELMVVHPGSGEEWILDGEVLTAGRSRRTDQFTLEIGLPGLDSVLREAFRSFVASGYGQIQEEVSLSGYGPPKIDDEGEPDRIESVVVDFEELETVGEYEEPTLSAKGDDGPGPVAKPSNAVTDVMDQPLLPGSTGENSVFASFFVEAAEAAVAESDLPRTARSPSSPPPLPPGSQTPSVPPPSSLQARSASVPPPLPDESEDSVRALRSARARSPSIPPPLPEDSEGPLRSSGSFRARSPSIPPPLPEDSERPLRSSGSLRARSPSIPPPLPEDSERPLRSSGSFRARSPSIPPPLPEDSEELPRFSGSPRARAASIPPPLPDDSDLHPTLPLPRSSPTLNAAPPPPRTPSTPFDGIDVPDSLPPRAAVEVDRRRSDRTFGIRIEPLARSRSQSSLELGLEQEIAVARTRVLQRPDDLSASLVLSELLTARGDYRLVDEAIDVVRRAAAVSPNHPVAHHRLAELFARKGDYTLAREHLGQAKRLGFSVDPDLERVVCSGVRAG